MKKVFKLFAILLVASLSFSCAKEIEVIVDNNDIQGSFEYVFQVAEADGDVTKTTLDGSTVKWVSGDKIGIFAKSNINKSGSITTLNPVQFPVYLSTALDAGEMLYAYYPWSSSNSSATAATVNLVIPETQTGNFDAMPQVAIPYETTAAMSTGTNNTDVLRFCNLGSVVRFYVYSSGGTFTGETVESIQFNANTALAGSFTFDMTGIDYETPSSLAITGYAAKSVKMTAAPTIGTNTSNAGKAEIVIAPGTYYGTVVLTTDVARYTYEISEPNKITFERSKMKNLGLDLESTKCTRALRHPVGEVFVPATSISAGDKIVIASGTEGSIGVFGEDRGNNRLGYAYTIDGGAIVTDENIYPLTVGTGVTNASYFTLYDNDNDGYIAASSSTSNNLKTNAAISVDSEWQIVIDSNSKATSFDATASSYDRKFFRYNGSNTPPLFSAYASGKQSDVYIFKKTTATFISAANLDLAYTVTSVTIDYNVYNGSGTTTVAFKTNPGDCASNLAINEGTKKVTFDITANDGATRTVEVNITNNGVTKTVSINQAAAPSKLVMSTITAAPAQTQIVFSWDAVDGAAGYQISTNDGTTYGSTQAGTSYTWTGLTAFTEYTIKVKAIGDGIYHLDSDAASKTQKTTLAVPTGITWTKASKTVTWTDTNTSVGTYGTDYKYQYTIDNGETFTDVAIPGTSVVLSSITETKTIKIKAVYITDATLNSAASSGTTCLLGAPAVYTASFNGSGEYTSSPSYDSNNYTVSGVEWALSYADIVSTGSPLDGTANIQGRIAKNTTNSPSATTKNLITSSTEIEKVSFWMSKTSDAVTFTVEYSIDGGLNWINLTYSKDTAVDATYGYSGTLNTTTEDFRLKFTWSVTATTKSNRDQKLDNVIVYGE